MILTKDKIIIFLPDKNTFRLIKEIDVKKINNVVLSKYGKNRGVSISISLNEYYLIQLINSEKYKVDVSETEKLYYLIKDLIVNK